MLSATDFSANVCHRAGHRIKFSCYFPSWNIIVILVNNHFFSWIVKRGFLNAARSILVTAARHLLHCEQMLNTKPGEKLTPIFIWNKTLKPRDLKS
jgi:hypothetical protein